MIKKKMEAWCGGRRLCCFALLIFLEPFLTLPSPSQDKKPDAEKDKRIAMLEVVATDYQAYTQKKFLLARVFEDGLVEYQDPLHVDLMHPALIRKELAPQDIAQLRKILADPEVRKLSGEYHGWSGVDTSVRWDFVVNGGDKARKFVLWNFTYPKGWVSKNVRLIPKEADGLGCFLLRINENSLHFRGMPGRCMEPKQPK